MRKLLLIPLLLAVFLCAGCVNREAEKAKVFRLVKENRETLLSDIAANDFAKSKRIRGIEDIQAKSKWGNPPVFVEYECGGAGFGPSTSYWGFYYSKDDNMTEIWCSGEPLVKENGGFRYRQEGGDNTYYTEHITDHFFYYYASY